MKPPRSIFGRPLRSGIATRETQPVYRKPYTPEELKRILAAAKDDEFIRPILITAMCAAMRRGDCCLLKWSEVNLNKRFLTVKTGKTGAAGGHPDL